MSNGEDPLTSSQIEELRRKLDDVKEKREETRAIRVQSLENRLDDIVIRVVKLESNMSWTKILAIAITALCGLLALIYKALTAID